jgi:hypothetical protein
MLEGVWSKSFEDLEFQEQELKTLSSYSLKESQVFSWSFFSFGPNNHSKYNFFFMHACVLILMDSN